MIDIFEISYSIKARASRALKLAPILQNKEKILTIKVANVLSTMILLHLSLVIFSHQFRSLVFDTTFVRDLLLWLMILFGIIIRCSYLIDKRKSPFRIKRVNLLDGLIVIYITYGILLILYNMFYRDTAIPLLISGLQFRNYFLPLVLCGFAKTAFSFSVYRNRLCGFFKVVITVNVLYIILEYLTYRVGVDMHTLPWHRWFISVHGRYATIGQISTAWDELGEIPPVLGLLGFPHYTAPMVVALFAFVWPSLTKPKVIIRLNELAAYRTKFLFLGMVLFVISVICLGVKSHMVTALLIIFVLPFYFKPRLVIVAAVSLFIIVIFVSLDSQIVVKFNHLWNQVVVGNDVEGSRIKAIFNVIDEVNFISNMPLESLLLGTSKVNLYSDMSAQGLFFEIKLMWFSILFGLVWIIIFVGIFAVGIIYSYRLLRNGRVFAMDRRIIIGSLGFLCVYFIELGHFGRTMELPNIDIVAVVLGLLSAMYDKMGRHMGIGYNKRTIPDNSVTPSIQGRLICKLNTPGP